MEGVSSVDRDKVWQFLEHFTDLAAGAATVGVLAVADRAGLLAKMAKTEWVTPLELAGDQFAPRYVEEILAALTTAAVVEHDPDAGAFRLPAEHAAVLADPSSPYSMAGWLDMLPGVMDKIDAVAQATVKGGGVELASYDDRVVAGVDRANAPAMRVLLTRRWLPAMPEIAKRLEEGIRAADIGCGSGAAALAMAGAYPASKVIGYDVDPRAIERARMQMEASGLDNVSFEVLSGEEIPEGFDLITTFDVIHDLTDPEAVLIHIRDALNPRGTYLMMEPNVGADLADNVHARGSLLYGISVLYCLPQSLVAGGRGLGTAWGPVRAEELCRKVGFTHFRRLEIDNPFSAFYEIRP
jgi:2-polyprenyl-3-methyl-5-hydroxy-6-metoxy-1,4-benzoquinol methylase